MPESELCNDCGAELIEPKVVHMRRTGERCGRTTFKTPSPDGLHIQAGDTPIIPAGAIRLSLDPREATGHFTEYGVSFFVRMLLQGKAAPKPDEIATSLQSLVEQGEDFLQHSRLLAHLDPESHDGSKIAFERLEKQKETREWLAMLISSFASIALRGIDTADPALAAWGAQQAMVAHSAFVFEGNLKDLVWRGYVNFGVDQISEALQFWEAQKNNPDEEFWHQALRERPFLMNQLLASPVVIERDKAYVGGKGVTNTGGTVADFLLRHPALDNVALLEIKTPVTPLLLTTPYRAGVYGPSQKFAGGAVQLAGYRDTLLKELLRPYPRGLPFQGVQSSMRTPYWQRRAAARRAPATGIV
jgi:antiviral defense system Shedu protein SduA